MKRARLWTRVKLIACLVIFGSANCWLRADTNSPAEKKQTYYYAVIEAEEMTLSGDWRVAAEGEGYFPAYPQFWSGGCLRGGAGPESATAFAEIEIPSNGTYAVWVRYESPYGFDALFDVAIYQGGGFGRGHQPVYSERFGDRNDLKAFGGNWRVQGPWAYHNTDYVYQRGEAQLSKGKARVVLSKEGAGKMEAARIVDLIAITDDFERNQALRTRPQPWDPVCVVDHCKRSFYFRVQVPAGKESCVGMTYGLFSPSSGIGFNVAIPFTTNPIFQVYRPGRFPLPKNVTHEPLPAGFDTGWRKFDLSTLCTAKINFHSDAPATFSVARRPDGRDAVSFRFDPDEPETQEGVLVATGFTFIEKPMMGSDWILTQSEVSRRRLEALKEHRVPGKAPVRFRVQASGGSNTVGKFYNEIKAEAGRNTAGYEPEVYRADAAGAKRINRAAGGYYFGMHNALLNRACYEGDHSKYEAALRRLKERAENDGIGDMPWLMKLIEESGPPSLATLRDWPIIAERFRQWLKERKTDPLTLLSASDLADALKAKATDEKSLWNRVLLSDGSIQAAAENSTLFYLSKRFAGELFIDNLAAGVKLIEAILPKGSAGDLGCAWTQDGHGIRRNWYDEMELFRRRGATAFGTENTWGLCGMAHYIGPQTESYQGAQARACGKYHADTRLDSTTAIFSWYLYGYPAEYSEITAYAMAANGIRGVCFATCGDFSTDEIWRAWKRAAYAIGGVEDRLFDAKNVPARVALGWSESTDIWDQAIPTDSGFNRPGNVMYQLERHYLYLLLRHMQLPVDLLSEADIEEGRLKDYELYWMVGDHITQRAAAWIKEWVAEGGTLLSSAGGGLFDEYNRPLDTLAEVYGIKGQRQYAGEQGKEYIPGQLYNENPRDNRLERIEQAPRAKLELIHAHPVDTITLTALGGHRMPVLACRQMFAVSDGVAVGQFNGGQPAVITNGFGKGRALICGFLPGVSYFYGAFPAVPYGRGGEDLSVNLYPQCKPQVREAMTDLMRAVWPRMVIPVKASNPFVEANLLRNGERYYVALVNFSGAPIKELVLSIAKSECGGAGSAIAEYTTAKTSDKGDFFTVKMALDKFDFLTLKP